MSDFEIFSDSSTYKFSENEVYGIIYLRHKDVSFPNELWDDLCLSMILIWGSSLMSIVPGQDDSLRLRFMDGPFYLDIEYKNEQAEVRLYRNKKQISLFSTTMRNIVCSWLKACNTMYNYLQGISEFTDLKILADMERFMNMLKNNWKIS